MPGLGLPAVLVMKVVIGTIPLFCYSVILFPSTLRAVGRLRNIKATICACKPSCLTRTHAIALNGLTPGARYYVLINYGCSVWQGQCSGSTQQQHGGKAKGCIPGS